MKLGTSLRFLFPNGPHIIEAFKRVAQNLPPGEFMDQPSGAFETSMQVSNLIDVSRAVRAADLDLLLLGEHHAAPTNVFQPVPTLARLSAETGSVPLGALFLAPFHHPILLAEQIGTLAAFVPGPLTVAFAVGGNQRQFDAFGMQMATRGSRTEELIEVVRLLLAGEPVSFQGRHHHLEGVTVNPVPQTPVHIWIGGRRGAAVDRAGRLGDGWISDTTASDEQLATELDRYQQAAAHAGRQPYAVLRRDVFVAETDAEALQVVEPILADAYRGLTLDRVMVGSPATVLDQLAHYEQMGFAMALVRHIPGDHHLMIESFGRIGRQIIPALRAVSARADAQ